MASSGSLLDYGIAINFLGNYKSEGSAVGKVTDKLQGSLLSLQRLVIGGGIVAGLYKFSSSLLMTATMMERNFAMLKSSLGSSEKAIETLKWAAEKGAKTPFGIEEVNNAVTMMTRMGFAETKAMREEVFNAIGDFAGQNGAGFSDIMSKVARASFGNWASLGQTYGIRQETIGQMTRDQMARTPDKYKGEESGIAKAIELVEKGKKGTDEYKLAIVKLLGVLGRDGMLNRINTISGAWGEVDDIVSSLTMSIVGYTQVAGTFSNAIMTTIKDSILAPFNKSHTVIINGIKEQTTAIDQLGRIGKGVGEIFKGMWTMIDSAIAGGTDNLMGYIDRMDAFFSDYKNNIAPLILFIALMKIEVELFFDGFMEGFKYTFGLFLKLIKDVYTNGAKFLKWLGIAKTDAEALGIIVGGTIGILLGLRAYKFATKPFDYALNTGGKFLKLLDKIIFKQKISSALNDIMAGNFKTGFGSMVSGAKKLIAPLTGVAASAWSFTSALLANPITWIVVAVLALVAGLAYLIYNWDEVGQKMQGVSDIALVMMTLFLPMIGIPLLLARHWESFSVIFSNIWRGVKAIFHAIWLYLREEWIKPIGAMFGFLWKNAVDSVNLFIDAIKTKFPFIQIIFENMRDIWETITGFIMKIWDKLTDNSFISGLMKAGEIISGFLGDKAESIEGAGVDRYGSEKEKKDYYSKIALQKIRNSDDTTPEGNTIINVGGMSVTQNAGEDGKDFADRVAMELYNIKSKQGI